LTAEGTAAFTHPTPTPPLQSASFPIIRQKKTKAVILTAVKSFAPKGNIKPSRANAARLAALRHAQGCIAESYSRL
jgi:hypothetical protein